MVPLLLERGHGARENPPRMVHVPPVVSAGRDVDGMGGDARQVLVGPHLYLVGCFALRRLLLPRHPAERVDTLVRDQRIWQVGYAGDLCSDVPDVLVHAHEPPSRVRIPVEQARIAAGGYRCAVAVGLRLVGGWRGVLRRQTWRRLLALVVGRWLRKLRGCRRRGRIRRRCGRIQRWQGRVRRWQGRVRLRRRRRPGLEARPRAARLVLPLGCGRLEALAEGGSGETGRLSCNSENIGK
jgi:hypothetical protein